MASKRWHLVHTGNGRVLLFSCMMPLLLSFVVAQPVNDSQSTGPASSANDTTSASQTIAPTPAAHEQPQTSASAAATTAPTLLQEKEAVRAAEEIVAQPGVLVQTTEYSDLRTTAAVVPTPSVVLSGNELRVAGSETTEAIAVKSGAELLLKLGIVSPKRPKTMAGLEIQETTPTQIFEDAEIRRMLNKDPNVVYQVSYQGTPIPDPMIVPWVRKAVVLKERFDQAIELLAEKRISEGREVLQEIIAEAPGSDYAIQAQEILKKLSDLAATPEAPKTILPKKTPAPTPAPDIIHIDSNVRVTATIVDPQDSGLSRVMINGRSYKQGDAVRSHPNHRVLRIRDDSVTIEVEQRGQRKLFDVPVRPQGF